MEPIEILVTFGADRVDIDTRPNADTLHREAEEAKANFYSGARRVPGDEQDLFPVRRERAVAILGKKIAAAVDDWRNRKFDRAMRDRIVRTVSAFASDTTRLTGVSFVVEQLGGGS